MADQNENKMTKVEEKKTEEFAYLDSMIQPPSAAEMELWPRAETFQEKFWRKVKANPFVPLGLGVTVAALTLGLKSMVVGDTRNSQKMMRMRVGAQGFTVMALLAGVAYSAYTGDNKRTFRPK